MSADEVFFEFVQVGHQMRVAAIHVATDTEIVVIAPLTLSRTQMQQLALAKLRKKISAAQPEATQRLF